MKHLSSILLAAAFLAAGVTACFKDPTGDLINGPMRIQLTRSSITLRTGDSLDISAEMKDAAGNTYSAAGTTWTSADEAVAVARLDTTYIPGSAFSRAFIRAAAAGGGVTTVTVSLGGLSAQFRVLVLPAILSPSATPTVTGTTSTDTVLISLPGGGVQRSIFTKGDTLVLTVAAGSKVYFNDTSRVSLGATRAYILDRTDSTRIRAVARGGPFQGRPWVTSLRYNGPAEVGVIQLDSLRVDSVDLARPRFRGTVSVSAGIVMTIDAPAGLAFRTATPRTEVLLLDTARASIITRTATQIVVSNTAANYTGGVRLTNVDFGTAIRFDTLWTSANYTLNRISFPGTVATGGKLLDTVKVAAAGLLNASTSNVVTGGQGAFVIRRTTDSIVAIPKLPGLVSVTNVTIAGVNFPSLSRVPPDTVTATTGEANEPGNNTLAGATSLDLTGTSAASPLDVYASGDESSDHSDYYTVTLAAPAVINAVLAWYGDGGGATSANPDLDVMICGPFPATCSYGNDLVANAASGVAQPEAFTTGTLAVGTYILRVRTWVTPGPITYRLSLNLQ